MSIKQLKEIFEHTLHRIPENEQLILLFDSIDQLQVKYYDCSTWLPVSYSPNVKCIVSTIPVITKYINTMKIEHKILEGLRTLFPECSLIEIKNLDQQEASHMFDSWLQHDRRRLTSLQMSWLEPKLVPFISHTSSDDESEPTPLFLSLLYERTVTWHSYDDKPDNKLTNIKTTKDAISSLYEQMCKKHGTILFRRAMTYLQLAGGLSEYELEDLLGGDNIVLESVFSHHFPPLNTFRLPDTLWIRIRNDMQNYFVEKNVDDIPVIYL